MTPRDRCHEQQQPLLDAVAGLLRPTLASSCRNAAGNGRAATGVRAGAKIAVAFSGGLDSSVLTHLLGRLGAEYGMPVIALHVHHGLQADAEAWLAHCRERACAWRLEFDARRAAVALDAGLGLEAAARQARHAALLEMCRAHGATELLLAHHRDDQAETVMLQMLRGAGVDGLAAMQPVRRASHAPGAAVRLLRPLLGFSRAALRAYAQQQDLDWIEDPSNANTEIRRNALRHTVMPALSRLQPLAPAMLARTAAHMREARGLLDELAELDLRDGAQAGPRLELATLLPLGDARLRNALRFWITRRIGLRSPPEGRLQALVRQLRAADADSICLWQHDGFRFRWWRGALWPESGRGDESADESRLTWRGERAWVLPRWGGTLVFERVDGVPVHDTPPAPPAASEDGPGGGHESEARGDKLATPVSAIPEAALRAAVLQARPRRGGERIRLRRDGPSRALKQAFQQHGVPPWNRDGPVITLGERLILVAGLGADATPWPPMPGAWWRLRWQPDDGNEGVGPVPGSD